MARRSNAKASLKKAVQQSPGSLKGHGVPSDDYVAGLVKKTIRDSFAGFSEYEIDSKVVNERTLRQTPHHDRAEWLKQSEYGRTISLGVHIIIRQLGTSFARR